MFDKDFGSMFAKLIIQKSQYYHPFIGIGLFICLICSGCAQSTIQRHPHFNDHRQTMTTLLVPMPVISVFESLPDGTQFKQNQVSWNLQHVAQQAIVDQLIQRGFKVSRSSFEKTQHPDLRSVTSLFKSVNRSIQLHVLGPQIFPAKIRNFEYSVGSISAILADANADGLVLTMGYQFGIVQKNETWFSIAVCNPDGQIIWYRMLSSHPQIKPGSATEIPDLVNKTMGVFWNSGQ